VQALAGSPSGVSLRLTRRLPELRWEVMAGTNTIASQRRRTDPSQPTDAEVWDIRFHQPLHESVTLRATAALPPGEPILLPLPARAASADELEGTIVLRSVADGALEAESPGFDKVEPVLPAGVKLEPPVWRAYHHGAEPGPFTVRLHGAGNAGAEGCVVESAVLFSETALRGAINSRFECVVRNPRGQQLRLRLPAAATLQSLAVNHAWVPLPEVVDECVNLPPGSGSLTTVYELAFQQDMPRWFAGGILPSSLPEWEPLVPVLQ